MGGSIEGVVKTRLGSGFTVTPAFFRGVHCNPEDPEAIRGAAKAHLATTVWWSSTIGSCYGTIHSMFVS